MLLRHSQCRTNLPTIGKLFERALARDEQLGLLGEWSEDIDCLLTALPAHVIPVFHYYFFILYLVLNYF